ncbi:MAG: efflux transporter outer membrane subunit [Rhodocyclaceae bacterium]|nr:efflux transporter outer membrane subunit [Rhodocyclaceae bacterium]
MRPTLFLLLPLLLAGCMGTELVRPPAPVAEQWTGVTPASPPENESRPASLIAWRDFFTDPRLQQLITIALENNRDLRVAAARLEAARAEHGISRTDRLPAIEGNLTQSNQGWPAELATSGKPFTYRRADFSLGVASFELDLWNRLGSLSDSAKYAYLATESAQRTVRLSLISEIASTYYTQLELVERLEMSRRNLEMREKAYALNLLAFEQGFASSVETQTALGLVEAARGEIIQLRRTQANASNKMDYLLGKKAENLPEGRALAAQNIDGGLFPGLPAEVLLQRPDVAAAEQRLRSAHASVNAARAAFLPKILLTAGLGLASRSLASLFASGGNAWNFQPSMSMPLFDWGKTQGGVDLAEARKNIAVAEYEKTLQESFREVADLLAAREALMEQRRIADTQASINEQRLGSFRARQQEGVMSLLNVFDAEREWLSSRQNAIQIQRQQLENAALLYKALGGGEALPAETGNALALGSPPQSVVGHASLGTQLQ